MLQLLMTVVHIKSVTPNSVEYRNYIEHKDLRVEVVLEMVGNVWKVCASHGRCRGMDGAADAWAQRMTEAKVGDCVGRKHDRARKDGRNVCWRLFVRMGVWWMCRSDGARGDGRNVKPSVGNGAVGERDDDSAIVSAIRSRARPGASSPGAVRVRLGGNGRWRKKERRDGAWRPRLVSCAVVFDGNVHACGGIDGVTHARASDPEWIGLVASDVRECVSGCPARGREKARTGDGLGVDAPGTQAQGHVSKTRHVVVHDNDP